MFGVMGLIVLFIFRIFIKIYISSIAAWIVTIYYLPLAVIIICVEMGIEKFQKTFYFLNFMWGKGLMNLFISCISLCGYFLLEIPIAAFFFVTACLFFALHFVFKHDERVAAEQRMKAM